MISCLVILSAGATQCLSIVGAETLNFVVIVKGLAGQASLPLLALLYFLLSILALIPWRLLFLNIIFRDPGILLRVEPEALLLLSGRFT